MIRIDKPMPEACDVCPFNYDFCWCNAFEDRDEWEKYSDDWNDHVCDRETRPEYCPLKEQPEIVRCKDCKWAEVSDNEHTWCDHVDHEFCHNNDWFCADGEKGDE